MTQGGDVGLPEKTPERDPIKDLLKRANPNPERVGCLDPKVLNELANRVHPPNHPAYRHLGDCSRCFADVLALQARARRRVRWRWFAIAASILILAGGSWFLLPFTAPTRDARLDLRQYTVMRNDQQRSALKPIVLTRGRLNLEIILPVGSQPGLYDLQLLDGDLRSQAAAQAEARIENYLTTLETRLDLGAVAAGDYQLALRRQGEGWRWFPARVQ